MRGFECGVVENFARTKVASSGKEMEALSGRPRR
jgi:hypothetical protein